MGGRYWLTGAQLGILRASATSIPLAGTVALDMAKRTLDEIEKQFIGDMIEFNAMQRDWQKKDKNHRKLLMNTEYKMELDGSLSKVSETKQLDFQQPKEGEHYPWTCDNCGGKQWEQDKDGEYPIWYCKKCSWALWSD